MQLGDDLRAAVRANHCHQTLDLGIEVSDGPRDSSLGFKLLNPSKERVNLGVAGDFPVGHGYVTWRMPSAFSVKLIAPPLPLNVDRSFHATG